MDKALVAAVAHCASFTSYRALLATFVDHYAEDARRSFAADGKITPAAVLVSLVEQHILAIEAHFHQAPHM